MLYLGGTSQSKISGAQGSEESADNMNRPRMNFLLFSFLLRCLYLCVFSSTILLITELKQKAVSKRLQSSEYLKT